jgi:hypothetical protein
MVVYDKRCFPLLVGLVLPTVLLPLVREDSGGGSRAIAPVPVFPRQEGEVQHRGGRSSHEFWAIDYDYLETYNNGDNARS